MLTHTLIIMKNIVILLILIMVTNSTVVFCQEEQKRFVRTNVVQIDSLSLINSLLDTVFAIDKSCMRDTCNTNYVIISCSKIKPFSEQVQTYHFIVIDGDCTVIGDSVKGVSQYRGRTVFWVKDIPVNMLCNNTEQQEDFLIIEENSPPIRDNIPVSYCYYYYGQLFIYKRAGCTFFGQDDVVFPIIINND